MEMNLRKLTNEELEALNRKLLLEQCHIDRKNKKKLAQLAECRLLVFHEMWRRGDWKFAEVKKP